MPGVRIHHVRERNRVIRLEHWGRLIRDNGALKPKTYHITLDDYGNAIVSETIWTRLQEAGWGGEFLVLNEVKEPPAQKIDVPHIVIKARPHQPGE